MAVVIKIDKNYIPVQIGELEFKFKIDDKSTEALKDKAQIVSELGKSEDVQELDVLKQAFDSFFEEGAGAKVYAECGESKIIMLQVFFETIKELVFEIMKKQGNDATKLSDEAKNKLFSEFLKDAFKKQQEELQATEETSQTAE